jgi:hypothetical protein
MSAAEIEKVAENDDEGALMSDEEWARAEIRQPINLKTAFRSSCVAENHGISLG